MKRFLSILFLWAALISSAHADVVVLHSGKTIKGEILLSNDEVLILRQKDGSRFQFPQQEVRSIEADAPSSPTTTPDTLDTRRVATLVSLAGGTTYTPSGWAGFVQPMLFLGAPIPQANNIAIGGSIGYHGVITAQQTYSYIPLQATIRYPILPQPATATTINQSLILAASIGYAFATNSQYEGGICTAIDLGWQKTIGRHTAFYLALTAQCLQTRITTTEIIQGNAYHNHKGWALVSIGCNMGIWF